MLYRADFAGRQVGALGICYWVTTEVEADTPSRAEQIIYEKWEHISGLKLTPIVEKKGENPNKNS